MGNHVRSSHRYKETCAVATWKEKTKGKEIFLSGGYAISQKS